MKSCHESSAGAEDKRTTPAITFLRDWQFTSMSEVSTDDIKTAAVDMRFPSTNQARTCYTRYNEYYKCLQVKGDDCDECTTFKKAALALCPMDWIEKWEDAREGGECASATLPLQWCSCQHVP